MRWREMARALMYAGYERAAGELLVALDAGELPPRIIGRELERLARRSPGRGGDGDGRTRRASSAMPHGSVGA